MTYVPYRTRSRQTGTHIIVRRADDGEGWETICDEHATVCVHATKADAQYFRSAPLSWCESCMAIQEAMADEKRVYIEGEGWITRKPMGPHYLQHVGRTNLGGSPVQGGGQFYGSVGRCQCGVNFKTNEGPPSKGGRKIIEQMHRGHVIKEVLGSGKTRRVRLAESPGGLVVTPIAVVKRAV